jgi:hypothetical protein
MALLANELNSIAVSAVAAARATATSPPGLTACTPVGEMITGSEMSSRRILGRLVTVVGRVGPARTP